MAAASRSGSPRSSPSLRITTTVRASTSSSRWRATKAARHSPMRVPPDQSGTAGGQPVQGGALPAGREPGGEADQLGVEGEHLGALRDPLQRAARTRAGSGHGDPSSRWCRRATPAAASRPAARAAPATRARPRSPPPGGGSGADRGGRARARARAGGCGAWRAARPAGSTSRSMAASSRSSHSSNGFFRRSGVVALAGLVAPGHLDLHLHRRPDGRGQRARPAGVAGPVRGARRREVAAPARPGATGARRDPRRPPRRAAGP